MNRRAPIGYVALAVLASCSGCSPSANGGPDKPASSSPAVRVPVPSAAPVRVEVDLVQVLPSCDLEHRGPFIDTGTDSMVGRNGWIRGLPPGISPVEHDGSTWARVTDRKVQLTFSMVESAPIFVAARSQGFAARAASVALDDQPLGTLNFHREHIRIATTGTTTLPVDPGLHTLTLRFFGRARDGDPFADFDWIRVGVPDDNNATFGPPTLRDAIAPAAAIAGVPHRSIALRAPSTVRCPLRVPAGAHLRTAIGVQGTGEGEAEIRVVRDGKKPEHLSTVHVEGGDKATWTDVEVPLDQLVASAGAIELRATQAPVGGRVLFGDPVVALPATTAPPKVPARVVVIVVLDGVERVELPPWNGANSSTLPALSELAANGTTFDQHRAPTSVVAAVFASLLSGLAPASHGLTDGGARLPPGVSTIATIARDASVRAAMFTGVPSTFRAFGFGDGWEKFVERPPQSGAAATAPIDEAAAWITDVAKSSTEARMLVVVHARGGHPPWDVTAKELATAAPPDYGGLVEPRTAAQKIAQFRRARRANVVTDADRQRIRALETIALAGQDRALGSLVAALHAQGLWDSTLLMVTGDVASGTSELFGDGMDLKEPILTLPLYAHFPDGAGSGLRMGEPTEIVDLARTGLSALGLANPGKPPGRDLARVVMGLESARTGPQIATIEGRYAARWGNLVLFGKYPAPPRLCDLALDPTCAFDRREAMPIATSAIFRRIVAKDLSTRVAAGKREPATIDADTAAALRVWGASE